MKITNYRLQITNSLLAALFLACALLATAANSAEAPAWVTFTPPKPIAAGAGKAAAVDLQFRVRQGYHINSSHPRSALLIPTRLTLNLPAELRLAGISYPAGKTLTLSFDPTEPLSVYSGAFAIRAELEPAKPGSYAVSGSLRYQACSDRACYPPKTLAVTFQITVRSRDGK